MGGATHPCVCVVISLGLQSWHRLCIKDRKLVDDDVNVAIGLNVETLPC